MRSVRAITCRADVDDSRTLDDAREQAAAGDESWQQWADEYDQGRALVLRLEITIAFDGVDAINEVTAVNHGVWIETSNHPPSVAGQIGEIVSKDYNSLSAQLRREGVQVTASDLTDMHAEIELSSDLLRAIDEKPPGDRGLLPEIEGSGG